VSLTCKRVAARADTAVVTLVSDGLRLNMSTRCNMSTNIDNRVCHRSACMSTRHKSEGRGTGRRLTTRHNKRKQASAATPAKPDPTTPRPAVPLASPYETLLPLVWFLPYRPCVCVRHICVCVCVFLCLRRERVCERERCVCSCA
jgi:hypothetical protein